MIGDIFNICSYKFSNLNFTFFLVKGYTVFISYTFFNAFVAFCKLSRHEKMMLRRHGIIGNNISNFFPRIKPQARKTFLFQSI